MFAIYLLLTVFSFSVKLSSFALASKAKIILHNSHLCTHLTFATCCKLDSKSIGGGEGGGGTSTLWFLS